MLDYIKQNSDVIKSSPFNFKNLEEYRENLSDARQYLEKKDEILRSIILKIGDCRLKPHKKYFETLVDAIVSQQLSVKVAETIFKRFKLLFNKSSGKPAGFPKPDNILLMNDDKMRACGLSNAKVKYVKDLALHIKNREIKVQKLKNLPDAEIINELIKVKGIGIWTAQMFLIFCLGRFNVLPAGDMGLKKAVMANYHLRRLPGENQIKKISANFNWEPYNSIATWYLWQSLRLK